VVNKETRYAPRSIKPGGMSKSPRERVNAVTCKNTNWKQRQLDFSGFIILSVGMKQRAQRTNLGDRMKSKNPAATRGQRIRTRRRCG